jgi:hypothetical protein
MAGARRWRLEWARLDELAALLALARRWSSPLTSRRTPWRISATALRGATQSTSPASWHDMLAYVSTAVPELRVEPMELERLRCRLIGATE